MLKPIFIEFELKDHAQFLKKKLFKNNKNIDKRSNEVILNHNDVVVSWHSFS